MFESIYMYSLARTGVPLILEALREKWRLDCGVELDDLFSSNNATGRHDFSDVYSEIWCNGKPFSLTVLTP